MTRTVKSLAETRIAVPVVATTPAETYDSPKTAKLKLKYGFIPETEKTRRRYVCGYFRYLAEERHLQRFEEAAKASKGLVQIAVEAREAKEAEKLAKKKARGPKKPKKIGMPPRKKKRVTKTTAPKTAPKKIEKTNTTKTTTKPAPEEGRSKDEGSGFAQLLCNNSELTPAIKRKVIAMADDSLNEREKMLQQREEELAALEADVEVQEKILTLRYAIDKERIRRGSSVHEAEDDYGVDQYADEDEAVEPDAPVFECRAEDSDDEDVLERIGYNRENDFASVLKPCEYEYLEVSDEQIRRLRSAGGMPAYALQDEDINIYGPRDSDPGFENEDYSSDSPRPLTARELAEEEHCSHKRRDVVPDEAQMSKRMLAQDWALKHEAVSKMFARDDRGSSIFRQVRGEDAIIINAHSDQRGRIKGKTFAWTRSAAAASDSEQNEDELPGYESDNALDASTIILSENQRPQRAAGSMIKGTGAVRGSQGVLNVQGIARAADTGLASSSTSNQMNRTLPGANADHFVDTSSQSLRNAQVIAAAANGRRMSPNTFNQTNRNRVTNNDDPFVEEESQGMQNARAITRAAWGASAHVPSPNTVSQINNALLTTNDDPFVDAAHGGQRTSGRAPLADITARTLLAPPGFTGGNQVPSHSLNPSASDGLLPLPSFNTGTTTSSSDTTRPPATSNTFSPRPPVARKRKLSTIEEDHEYHADSGGVSSGAEHQRPKKKLTRKHFADLPRSRYRGGEVPSDDELEYRDTLERW